MFWKSILVIAICLVTIEAVDDELEQIPSEEYTIDSWRNDVVLLYRIQDRKSAVSKAVLRTLERMLEFQNKPEFKHTFDDPRRISRWRKVVNFLETVTKIVEETTLLRKPKNVSQNISDFIKNHNGCSPEEMSKIEAIVEVLGEKTRIALAVRSLRFATFSYCLDKYKDLINSTKKLIGQQSINVILRLSDLINEKSVKILYSSDLAYNTQNPRPFIIESFSKAVASYLKGLQHPGFDDVRSKSSEDIHLIIEEIYEIEIHQHVSRFCTIFTPTNNHPVGITVNVNPAITRHLRLLDASCNLMSLWSMSGKFRELTLIYTESLITYRPVIHDHRLEFSQVKLNEYSVYNWKDDVHRLFGKKWEKNPKIPETLFRLENMKNCEHTDQFRSSLGDVISGAPRLQNYLTSSIRIPSETTLLRKTKTVSENLIDIFSNHNGCSSDEISKIVNLARIFKTKSRINKVLVNLEELTIAHCRENYQNLMNKTTKLIGKAYLSILLKLSKFVNTQQLTDFVTNRDYASKTSIDSVSNGLALYLSSIDNPSIEDIESQDLIQVESTIADLYDIEIRIPVATLCNLLNPIRKAFSHIDIGTREDMMPLYLQLVEFSCSLASLAPTSIKSRIVQHFLNIRLDIF